VLLALSAGQKTGLALVAAAFVVFALTSALWIPRFRPDFPGRGLRLFIGVTVLFTIGMLAAVIALGKESEKEKTAEPGTTTTAPATTAPATTAPATTAPATTAPGTTTAPPPAGNAQAGKQLFASNGCGSCHTFVPAGSKGTVGPDLDHVAADAQKANRGSVAQYVHESIANPSAYVVPGFPNGVMPSFANLGSAKIDDLVAFLTQSS